MTPTELKQAESAESWRLLGGRGEEGWMEAACVAYVRWDEEAAAAADALSA